MSELLANTLVFQRQNSRLSRLVTGARNLWHKVKSAVTGNETSLPIHDVETLALPTTPAARASALFSVGDLPAFAQPQVREPQNLDVTLEALTREMKRPAKAGPKPLPPLPTIVEAKSTFPHEIIPARVENPSVDLVGTTVAGRYQIKEEIGRGGLGVVYRAYDKELRREVAFKTIVQDSETARGALLAEMHVAQIMGVEGRNVVDCLACGENFIIFEYLKGHSLQNYINIQAGAPALTTDSAIAALKIIREVLVGLESLQERGVVHADISPANVNIDGDLRDVLFGRAKIDLLDLGFGTYYEQARRGGDILGKPVYVSPEQAKNEALDGRSDVYSTGLTLYYLLSGRRPFENLAGANRMFPDRDMLYEIIDRRKVGDAFGLSLPIVMRSRIIRIFGGEGHENIWQDFFVNNDSNDMILIFKPDAERLINERLNGDEVKIASLMKYIRPPLLDLRRVSNENNLHYRIYALLNTMTAADRENRFDVVGARLAAQAILEDFGYTF